MIPETPSDPPLRRLELPSGPAAVTDVGEGPVIVAIPGLPGSVRDFRWLGSALEGRFRFVRLDMPGFGGTPVGGRGTSLGARTAFVVEVLDALSLGCVALLGHSMGGPVATAVAAHHPERVERLVLLASVGLREHRLLRAFRTRRALSLAFRLPPLRRLLLPHARAAFVRAGFPGSLTDVEIVQTVHAVAATSVPEHARNLRALAVPTFVAWTEDDPLVEREISEELYWACPAGPRVAFPDGGHNLQKTRAVELGEALGRWIGEGAG